MERRNYDELRARILAGEEAQLTVRTTDWHAQGVISTKVIGELRLRSESGRWAKKPEITLVPNPDNGPEDAASVLGSFARWLEHGRTAEVTE